MSSGKDTIYIDVDEEITGIVNKIQSSPKQIIALVLPKRANSLQSIVNMKLLKRTADQNDKQVVLITSEPRLLPLAGIAKLHVAPNLTSKPYLPDGPGSGSPADNAVEIDEGEIDPATPVSKLAPNASFADDQDPIEIDNTPKASKDPTSKSSPSKNKKFNIPNFTKFRKKIVIIALAVLLLIFGLIYGLVVAPKAKVVVKAQTSNLPLSLEFTADTTATSLNKENKIVQALKKEADKNDSERVEATGEKNQGKKAAGSVSITAQKCAPNLGQPDPVPAGTGVSTNGQTYITQSSTSFSNPQVSSPNCVTYQGGSTAITAQSPGEKFNISGSTNFTVAGRSDTSASGTASGGTDKNVKVVSQTDIDKAKERLNSKQNTVQEELKTEFSRAGYIAIVETFEDSDAVYTPSVKAGTEASEVTVSIEVKYTMLGVNEADIKELIKDAVNQQSQNGAQMVLSDGLAAAIFKPLSEAETDNQSNFALNVDVITGPDLNQDEIKQLITGKKKGEAEELLKKRPGVTEPSVKLSPFWVSKIPKISKINLEIQQADGSDIPGN